jgi:hypothetical protein
MHSLVFYSPVNHCVKSEILTIVELQLQCLWSQKHVPTKPHNFTSYTTAVIILFCYQGPGNSPTWWTPQNDTLRHWAQQSTVLAKICDQDQILSTGHLQDVLLQPNCEIFTGCADDDTQCLQEALSSGVH